MTSIPESSRRRFLLGAAVTGAAGLLAACQAAAPPAPAAPAAPAAAATAAPAAPVASSSTVPAIDKITQSKKLRIGWAAWQPYFVKDASGKITGIAVKTAEALANELKVELVMVEDSWSTFIAAMNADKFDFTFMV